MGLFSSRPSNEPTPSLPLASHIPVSQVDLSKRYDVYSMEANHDRLYENVRFVGIRTFDRITEYSSGFVHGFLEIEAANGCRALIPSYSIRTICEHGVQPFFKILRHRRNPRDD